MLPVLNAPLYPNLLWYAVAAALRSTTAPLSSHLGPAGCSLCIPGKSKMAASLLFTSACLMVHCASMEEGSVSDVVVCDLAYKGQLDELKTRILEDKSLATKTDQDNRTALHWACSAGQTHVVEFLLGLDVPVNDQDDAGWTPLHIAASAGRDDIVKSLIAKGAQVNVVNQNGCTPLHYAASKNRHEIAVMLLSNGANPDATDKLHSTPLHRAAAKGNHKMIQILLAHRASTNIQDNEGNTPLHLACDEERLDEAKLLVAHGASIYIENKQDKTPLQVAKSGFGAVLRRLVEGGNFQ